MAFRFRIIRRLFHYGLQVALGVCLGVVLFEYFLRTTVASYLMENVRIDVGILMRLGFYIFIGCSTILVILIYWLFWESHRLKSVYHHYASKLIAKDYYQDYEALDLKQALNGLTRIPQRKLDATDTGNEEKKEAETVQRTYYEDGQVEKELSYSGKKLDGVHRLYYRNGQVKREAHYKEGKLHGILRTFYPDGRIHQEKEYKDGQLDGIFRAFDEDGILFFEIQYKNNVQHGFDKIYYKNGLVQYWDTYENGVRVRRKTFNERGELKYDQSFR